jgi:hypothetical protein
MRDDYGKSDDGYIVPNPTQAEEKKPAEDQKPVARNESLDLGIDEKNYAPLRATRRFVGYVKKQDR